MRNKKVLLVIVSFLFSIVMMSSVVVVAFATADPNNPDEEVTSEPIYTEEVTEPISSEPTEEPTEPLTEEVTEEQTTEEYYEDVPEYETLPQVEDVTKPTEEEFPEYEVSDISLLGGVISWLCVAVGIAVIAGVLVSQRTKQVSGHRDNRRR